MSATTTNGTPLIAGIQQIGIGNKNVHETWRWYREHLGFDVPVFEEAAEAKLMLPYTGGKPRSRHAVLALNMRGGGGLEIWQYTCRTPQAADFQPLVGDLGIYIMKIKSADVCATHKFLLQKQAEVLGEITRNPAGQLHFYLNDPYGNLIEIVEGNSWFQPGERTMGGVYGCTIGVSDIDKSLAFYKQILGCDTVVFDKNESFDDLNCLPGGESSVRRVLLRHSQPHQGPFSKLLGDMELELVEVKNRSPRKIFKDRFWGDLGYIHLCFDITGMAAMKERCEAFGHPFTVDSDNSFDMGEAAGRFSYVEDPDGTLIEFVETHKVPILKKIGWYLDLRKREPGKALPNWMLKALGLNRVK
ncbi:MAG: VOC family protein [Saprospiraceae bacterium]|nr:VOC family protein [Saprospiraceae bacterium]